MKKARYLAVPGLMASLDREIRACWPWETAKLLAGSEWSEQQGQQGQQGQRVLWRPFWQLFSQAFSQQAFWQQLFWPAFWQQLFSLQAF